MNKELQDTLDSFALNIEFLLISVVQGIAIGALATSASDPLSTLQWQYWPYVLSSFFLVLIYWSEAIVHTISFIDWPLDLQHGFLYFLTSFLEVVAFNHITDPKVYFAFQAVFFAIVVYLYYYDLRMIRNRKAKFAISEKKQQLYQHIERRQWLELSRVMPIACLANVVSFVLVWLYPTIFIDQQYHVFLIGIQVLVMGGILFESMRNFKRRAYLISQAE